MNKKTSTANIKYVATILVGFLVDVCVASLVIQRFGTPLWFGATIGFLVAVAFNYFLFELWVYAGSVQTISVFRLFGTYASGIFALAIRLTFLVIIGFFIEGGPVIVALQLFCAAGLSMVANYILIQFLFKRP